MIRGFICRCRVMTAETRMARIIPPKEHRYGHVPSAICPQHPIPDPRKTTPPNLAARRTDPEERGLRYCRYFDLSCLVYRVLEAVGEPWQAWWVRQRSTGKRGKQLVTHGNPPPSVETHTTSKHSALRGTPKSDNHNYLTPTITSSAKTHGSLVRSEGGAAPL